MAKQQRASSRSGRSKPADASVSQDSRMLNSGRESQGTNHAVVAPIPRAGHLEAVALYEEGVAALQAHEFSRASALLRSVLSRYPEERELHERVRLYLNICERHMAPRAASPSTPEERVFAATLAVNAGNYAEAIEHLRTASSEAPEHDHALYMLASGTRAAGRARGGRSASAAGHRPQSRQSLARAPRPRPRRAARSRQHPHGARSHVQPQRRTP